MARASLATLLSSVLVAAIPACSGPTPVPSEQAPPPPDYIQRIETADGIERRLAIYDPNGDLAGVGSDVVGTQATIDIWWEPLAGNERSLVVGWLGGVCGVDPSLRLQRDGRRLSISVFDGRIPPSDDVCPAVGTIWSVILTFQEPLSSFDISVYLSESPH